MTETHRHIGNKAEDLACEFLLTKGWEILDRNYYSGHSEVDIIAKDDSFIVFLEVKMRSSTKFGSPLEHVTEAKVAHVFKAAETWVIENNAHDSPLRFDVISILKEENLPPLIEHIPDAFR
ncbi:MAG: YraN family protein [Balneola sp.]|nr:MAG: YraN family protein [Balneola sp.]